MLKNDKGEKCVIANYNLIPEMAVIDSVFSETVSAELAKNGGLTVLSLAVRAYTAPGASEYTQGFAREAVESVLANLEAAVAGCPAAREKMATAAAVAGMAYSNAADTVDTARAYTLPKRKRKILTRRSSISQNMSASAVQAMRKFSPHGSKLVKSSLHYSRLQVLL